MGKNKNKKKSVEPSIDQSEQDTTDAVPEAVSEDQSEAQQIKSMIQNMSKSVEKDSVWYIVSMNWIQKWQTHVGFEEGSRAQPEHSPGKIDNSDIIEEHYRDEKNQILSVQLAEQSEKIKHQNY